MRNFIGISICQNPLIDININIFRKFIIDIDIDVFQNFLVDIDIDIFQIYRYINIQHSISKSERKTPKYAENRQKLSDFAPILHHYFIDIFENLVIDVDILRKLHREWSYKVINIYIIEKCWYID